MVVTAAGPLRPIWVERGDMTILQEQIRPIMKSGFVLTERRVPGARKDCGGMCA